MLFITNGLPRAVLAFAARRHLLKTCITLRAASISRKPKTRQYASVGGLPKPRPYINPEDHQEPEQKSASSKLAIPERLEIYHAGALRTTVVAVSKLSLLFVWAGAASYGAATVGIFDMWSPISLTIGALGGWIVFYAYATSPFVRSVAIKVPPGARASEEALLRWSKRIPGDTPLELTTLRIHTAAKTTGVLLRELRTYKGPSWRPANLERVKVDVRGNRLPSPPVKSWGRWYLDGLQEPRYRFFVSGGSGKVAIPGVWEEVYRAVQALSKTDTKSSI